MVQKLQLTKYLLNSGRSREEITKLFSFIDWVMALPKLQELQYIKEIKEYSEENKVSYVTSFERYVMEEGIEKGIKQGIEIGEQRGRINGIREIILNMLDEGMKKEDAAKIAKMDLRKLEDLLKGSVTEC